MTQFLHIMFHLGQVIDLDQMLLLDIRVGHKEFMNEIRQQTTKISNGAASGYVTSDLSSNFIKFRIVKEF